MNAFQIAKACVMAYFVLGALIATPLAADELDESLSVIFEFSDTPIRSGDFVCVQASVRNHGKSVVRVENFYHDDVLFVEIRGMQISQFPLHVSRQRTNQNHLTIISVPPIIEPNQTIRIVGLIRLVLSDGSLIASGPRECQLTITTADRHDWDKDKQVSNYGNIVGKLLTLKFEGNVTKRDSVLPVFQELVHGYLRVPRQPYGVARDSGLWSKYQFPIRFSEDEAVMSARTKLEWETMRAKIHDDSTLARLIDFSKGYHVLMEGEKRNDERTREIISLLDPSDPIEQRWIIHHIKSELRSKDKAAYDELRTYATDKDLWDCYPSSP